MVVLIALLMGISWGHEIEKRGKGTKTFYISRYGRSGSNQRIPNVQPRNGKFFIGSRYGKRSLTSTQASDPGVNSSSEEVVPVIDIGMNCVYTGYINFYRCSERKETFTNDLQKSLEDPTDLSYNN
ncbi:RYamide neuropeptides-like isoform X2 [Chrysoperla carnea]|nr:RYamide neuropeptides-like isoform X2 [Chrysoperla carnea]